MSDRHEQARAEAERRYPAYPEFDQDDRDHTNAMRYIFLGGVEWADANPKPHTITRDELRTFKTTWWLADRKGLEGSRVEYALRSIGIEVEDEDE